ncbi:DNA polymerase III, alpha subunit [Streptomyces sp. 1222.5]|uniref:DNA polymerase III subunit alpha n=1 Tax=unclassified Streptomyces TaxID=2593676 RepID=UPI00089C1928|nr:MULTISPECIES: DNA polymerase III subunit alpha [unclassified Streptomyces]PKW06853.1 DNA polymerase III alpha subunit [Streptomyces sp. 5112.2]SED03781.1 DNA polymerase III, alpha subunit [Streptomyces sp. 1222.5]
MAGFAHLHVASGYSIRYGAAQPEHLARRAAERGMTALALTDRDTVTGAVRFAEACAGAGIRPIFGIDLAVAALAPPPPAQRHRTPARGGAHVVEPPLRFTLLAQNREGWARLCRVTSAGHVGAVSGTPPVVPWEALREYGGPGLTVLLGPLSEPVRALAAGREDAAVRLLAPWQEIFGEGTRLEAVVHKRFGTGPGSLRLAARTLALADRTRTTAVLSNSVRYADPDQHRLADVLDAARLLRPIDRRRLDSGQRWLKDEKSMAATALMITECAGADARRAGRLLADTAATADLCTVDPAADLGLGRPHFPEPSLFGAGPGTEGAARLLRARCEAGLVRRGLDRDRAALDRLDDELGVISELDYDSYFLAVGQVVADIREKGIRVAARGSGAGSMVCHALGIATANPLDHRLLFERFLSVRRASLPDIDIDVESARRLECYDTIFERFGKERVAVTAMPETYRARRALRDTGLALGIAPADVDRIAKSFPHLRASDISGALAELPELRQLAAEADRYGPLWELAEGLDSLVHGMAMHPCGVVISDATLLDRLPVQPTPQGDYPMAMAAKEEIEALGNIKLDVLGVRMQSAMAHAVTEIERTTGNHIDLDDPEQVPLDDVFAFKLIQESQTLGLFQLESPGQQDLLSRLQPRDPQDVIADISLFRPGPVAGGMPERYIAARHGGTPRYAHPDLEPVLSDTYGVTIWHEQIIETLSVMTGCDRALAEMARRALGDKERMPEIRDWFHQRAKARGYSEEVRDQVWKTVEAFGAYGFCRAHAVAFAVPALQSAWLKAHYPAFLLAGLLEHDPGMWPKRVLVSDARRRGVPVLPVDVNHSGVKHTVEKADGEQWGVRLALSAVHGISEEECTRIEEGQPYGSLSDFWQRGRPSRPVAERLAEIGALNSLHDGHLTRRDLLLQIAELHRQSRSRSAGKGQLPFDTHAVGGAEPSGLPELTGREALSAELSTLGIDVSKHLMEHHHRLLREIGATDAAHLAGLRAGQQVLVAGVRASTQTPPIASGKRIIFVTLEDGSGLVDLAFFEDSHPACAYTVFHSGLLLVRGTVQVRGTRRTVVGTMAWDLDEIAAARRDNGPEAALALIGSRHPHPTPAQPGRTLANGTTGARLHPYADLQPAGSRSADLKKFGYTSQGSAG